MPCRGWRVAEQLAGYVKPAPARPCPRPRADRAPRPREPRDVPVELSRPVCLKHAPAFIWTERGEQTNDQLGHLAGDEILKRAASLIGDWLGDDGIAGRIGGDEFAIILLRSHDLHARAAWLLQTLKRRGIRASLGAATQGGRAAIDLARAADTALLEARRSGKTSLRMAT